MYKQKIMDQLINTRRYLHQNPEVGFSTDKTISFLRNAITSHNIYNVKYIIDIVKGSLIFGLFPLSCIDNSKTIGFRADIDGLKIVELNDVSYKSNNSFMHACGHDAHTSILLTTIIYLLEHPYLIKNKLVFVFQAAEEGPRNGGAYYLFNHPLIKSIDYFFNLHVNSTLPSKVLFLKKDYLYASGTTFKIVIYGVSSHVNNYQEGIDSLKISLNVINKINLIKSTFLDPFDQSIIMINKFRSGKSTNVVSDYSVIEGTIRYFDSHSLSLIKDKIQCILNSEAIDYKVSYNNGYPAVINDSDLFSFLSNLLDKSSLNYQVLSDPFYLCDDFSRYMVNSKCFYFLLGTMKNKKIPLHSPYFEIDEESMYVGFILNLLILKNINLLASN